MTTKIEAPLYFHSDSESLCETYTELFPSADDDAVDVASGVGYEIEFIGEWNSDGEYWATGLKTEHGISEFNKPIRL